MCGEWHDRGIKVIYHSEGDITPVMNGIVAAGSDGVNHLEPDIVNIRRIREEIPDLNFLGRD